MTLFSWVHFSGYIHETLFAQFVISCSIIIVSEIIGDDCIFTSVLSRIYVIIKSLWIENVLQYFLLAMI